MNKWKFKIDRSRPSKETLNSTKDFEAVFQSYKQQRGWWQGANQWILLLAAGLVALGVVGWLNWSSDDNAIGEQKLTKELHEPTSTIENNNQDPVVKEQPVLIASKPSQSFAFPKPQRKLMQVDPAKPVQLQVGKHQISGLSTADNNADDPFEYHSYTGPLAMLNQQLDLPIVREQALIPFLFRFALRSQKSFDWEPVFENNTPDQLWFQTAEGSWESWDDHLQEEVHNRFLLSKRDTTNLSFSFEFDSASYPELANFKNVEFEPSAGFEKEVEVLLSYSWRCTEFKRKAAGQYQATFKKLKESRTVWMHPVLSVADYDRLLDSLKQVKINDLLPSETTTTTSWLLSSPLKNRDIKWARADFETNTVQSLQVDRAFWVFPNGIMRVDPQQTIPYWTNSEAKLYIQTATNQWLVADHHQIELLSSGKLRIQCESWSAVP